MSEELTYAQVSEHTTKKDLYLVIHDKVYNTSSFVDEHPYVKPRQQPALPPCPANRADVQSRSLPLFCVLILDSLLTVLDIL